MREMAQRTDTLKIVIVYASFGEGHRQAALALQQSFSNFGATNIVLLDLMAEAHPIINEFSRYFYMKSYTLWPQVYGWMYQATRSMKPNSLFAHWLHSFGADTLRRLIEKERPDAIIHTFPMLVLPSIARRVRRSIPMYNVVTDFDLHMRWVHPKIDKYYVATEDLRDQLAKTGVPAARIAATGIPLRSSFSSPYAAARAAERFGFDSDRPIVLVMCGAYGTRSGISELCRRLTMNGTQVALVCGRNRTLEAVMREKFGAVSEKDGRDGGIDGTGGSVRVFGFVDLIHELMAISSCIVTKPGGLTLTEAMQARLPMFLYRPTPGQELNNARYLAAKGAAVISRTPRALAAAIEDILSSPERLGAMQEAIAVLRKEDASNRIALDILQNLPILEAGGSEFEVRNEFPTLA